MKKLLLILCLFSMTAHAEWKYISSNDTNDVYIDNSRTKTEGGYKLVWDLTGYESPQTFQGKQVKSTVSKRVVDCQGQGIQTVAFYQYSEQMGKGAVVDSGNYPIKESDWMYPPPNSIMDGIVNIACGRK